MSSNELNFLIEFKNKYLHGNIDELADFSFWDINTNAGKYFSGNGNVQPEEYFDGDRTKIVYTIQYLLLDGSGIPNFSHDAPGRQYTGDTINTFNSLFGKTPELRKKIERKFGFSEREKELRNNFYRTYQCIGNFYILPTATVKSGNRIESINTLRGTNEWRDFFDLFLSNLDLCLSGAGNADARLKTLINIGINKEFFDTFPSVRDFCTLFYMEDYLQVDFNHPDNTSAVSHYTFTAGSDEYKAFALGYVKKASELIKCRSQKIIKALKTKYPELNFQKPKF